MSADRVSHLRARDSLVPNEKKDDDHRCFPKETKLFSSQVDALLICIKVERTALGLPNHIVGLSTAVIDSRIDNV